MNNKETGNLKLGLKNMGEYKKYIELKDLDAYKLSREYSNKCWRIYRKLNWELRKIIGNQMITSVDSVGANIAEGYGRFHYLDKNKFYYNARGSLLESGHWIGLLFERNIIKEEEHFELIELKEKINAKTNGLIKSQYNRKNNP